MKKTLFLLAFLMTIVLGAKADSFFDTTSMSAQDQNKPIGWGAAVTGGEELNQVTVTTLSELQSALTGSDKKTIIVDGTITFTGSVTIQGVENKSIYGKPGAILQNPTHSEDKSESGILTLKNCNNIIIRNLTFKAAGAYDIDGHDNLELQNSTNIWIDHCDFQDGVDGNLDCNNGSDNICVSWCRFRYLIAPWSGGSGGSDDHRFTNLWGGSDTASGDEGKLNTTFVNCWWDEGCRERMPRVRFGKVHILNCLYSSSAANYCVGGGYKSNVYIEKCAFAASGVLWKNCATEDGKTDYNYTITGCTGAADAKDRSGGADYYTPAYESYEASSVASVVSNASNGAGATLKLPPAEFRDFEVIVNNQTGTLLTQGEQVQGTAISFGVAVDNNGTVSRVAVDDPSSIATISGTYHSEHGMTGLKVVTTVPGAVTILVGQCTFSSKEIKVKNSSDDTVVTATPTTACWKNDRTNVTELVYNGEATTLTITGMDYCPFVAVKKYVAPAEFRDFEAIVNNQTGTLLTQGEQVQGTSISFGVAVDNNGTVSRVALDDPSSIATISGTYHSDHGMTGLKVVVPVPGKVTIQIGACTYSSSKITVTNSNSEKVIEYTPTAEQLVCWKNNHNNIIKLEYTGEPTTLTITGMSYCPFVAVKKVKTAIEKAIYSTDFSEWNTFSASTTETHVDKTTNFTDEMLRFTIYNTALMSTSDNKFEAYTTLPHNALQAAKASDPYVTTSQLANITKVRYIHGATGSSRGWKLEAKGDGDADWVVVSDSYASPAAWCEVTKNINKTNCQLRFTNLNSGQNAYMFELEIFAEVELTFYDITGTITGGNIDGSTITLTGNGEKYTATVTDGAFSMSVPAGTYTPSLSDNVPYLLVSPASIEVTKSGSIGTITIEAALPQSVTGQITNAPAEAFTLTFTGISNNKVLEMAAGATSYTTTLAPDTYTISTNVGTLSALSVESFQVVKDAVTHNIYFPEAAVPAATQQNIAVDNTLPAATANNYKTVTDALAAAKAGSISSPIITLTSGQTYREQVIVDQANVTFKTSGAEKATITWYYGIGYSYYSLDANGYYNKDRAMTRNDILMKDPDRWGCTVKVTKNANNFKAENIIFENSFNQYYTDEEVVDGVRPNGLQSITYDRTLTSGEGGYKAADAKAVTERAAAIAIENGPTGVELYNCEFVGSQDTFYSSGKIYVKNCNIIGNTDYIFGGGYVVFDDCDLTIGGYSDQNATAYITAYKDGNVLASDKKYVFRDCTVKTLATPRAYYAANLGRDWGGEAASVYYFNLKNEIGNKLSYSWSNMGGGVSAGTADLHVYDFDPTINANFKEHGSDKANINSVLSDDDAHDLYTEVVSRLGYMPAHLYDLQLDETNNHNAIKIAAANGSGLAGDVTLKRSITEGKWSTIVLPFAVSADKLITAFGPDYKLAELTTGDENTLNFTTQTAMEACKPYAIKVSVPFISATFEDVYIDSTTPEQTVGNWVFNGTYTSQTAPVDSYVFSGNKLRKVTGNNVTVKPFRAYITYNGVAPANELEFILDGETTGVETVYGLPFTVDSYYDLQGRKVVNGQWSSQRHTLSERMLNGQLKKGVYIVNGRKTVVK